MTYSICACVSIRVEGGDGSGGSVYVMIQGDYGHTLTVGK